NCIFYADDGGFAGTDEHNRPTNYIYYLGVIDILTPYNAVKKFEHAFKSVNHDKWYGKRFLDFMVKSIKHSDNDNETGNDQAMAEKSTSIS
ncbi:12647_t:CDS:2, partial [Racocetra fulgida]